MIVDYRAAKMSAETSSGLLLASTWNRGVQEILYYSIAAIEHTRCQHKMTNNNVVIIQDSRRGENKIAMRMRGCYSNAKLISFEKKAKMSTCEQSSVQCDSHKFLAFNMSSECRYNCRVCPALFIHNHLMLKT